MDRYNLLLNRTSKRKRIYNHREILDSNRTNKNFIPISLEVFPTNKCNSRCNFCIFKKFRDDELSFEIFEKIVDDCISLGIRSITFSGGGEPTLHEYLSKAIERLTDAKIEVGLITNGIDISDQLIKVLSKCSWIRISLLAGNAPKYESLTNMNYKIYYQVLRNITKICNQKSNDNKLIVGTTMLIDNDSLNVEEIKKYLDIVKSCNVDQIFFSEIIEHFGEYKLKKETLAEYVEEINSYVKNLGIVTNINKFLQKSIINFNYKEKGKPCVICSNGLMGLITADGNVYPCFGQYTNNGIKIGNVNNNNLKNMYIRDYYQKNIEEITLKKCNFCKNQNTKIELERYYMTHHVEEVNDPHASFI